MWLCVCDCGATHSVLSQSLRRGDTKRCPTCTRMHLAKQLCGRHNIVVELWFWTLGRTGGFATARDKTTGQLITHSHNSRTPLTTRDAVYYPQMRNIAHRLARMGLIAPHNPRHSYLRWYKDQGIMPKVHTVTSNELLRTIWAECEASGTGPVVEEVERPAAERRKNPGMTVVDGVAVPV